jgi:hypothetical protein
MLSEDSVRAARKLANELYDSRLRHFYDSERRVGKAIAEVLGAAGQTAWDTYLFYEAGMVWQSEPPRPVGWVHQLTDSMWADPEHRTVGDKLRVAVDNHLQTLIAGYLR